MEVRSNLIWKVLITVSGIFTLLYLYSTLLPGGIDIAVFHYFTEEQVQAGRSYNGIVRLIYISSFILKASFLIWFVFSGRAERLGRWTFNTAQGRHLLAVLLFFLILWLSLRLLSIPFSLYSSYFLQHEWGFSTQTMSGWWLDYFKGAAIDVLLSAVGVLLLFWATGRWPNSWWFIAGIFLAFWIFMQSFLWPVMVAPLFNRFESVRETKIVEMVQRLSERAELPVDEVLVMDASIRTTKANAYFSGLGSTKRIVLYDNLLNDYSFEEVEAVVAHEMAHWKSGHITRGILFGIVGNFILLLLLFLTLRLTHPLSTQGPYPPQAWALIVLFFLLVSFLSNPLQNIISRGMETEADLKAVELTQNPSGSVQLQVNLARKNLSGVAPPQFIEWFSYSHPSVMRRIRNFEGYEAVQ